MDLSPYSHLPKLPDTDATAAPFVWLLALSALFALLGLVGVQPARHRLIPGGPSSHGKPPLKTCAVGAVADSGGALP